MTTNEKQYREWASGCSHLPVFFQPWWLDAVCPGAWGVGLAKDGSGNIIAVLPFFMKKKWGLSSLEMPPLTAYLGPWYDLPPGLKNASRYALEHTAQEQLLLQLPRAVFFRQRWHPQLVNALPFRWKGFRIEVKYTYCIELGNKGWEDGFTAALRNNIRNAEKQYEVLQSPSAEGFYELNKQTFAAQNIAMPYSEEQFLSLDKAAEQQQARCLYWAINKSSGKREATIYIVKDQNYAYLLATSRLPGAHSGAVALLISQSIQDLAVEGIRVFDFEGSSLKGVEGFFRQFGGALKMGLVLRRDLKLSI